MGSENLLSALFKTVVAKNEGKKLEEAFTRTEYRKNVFRNDNQRLAAFYFSDENKAEIEKKGCFSKGAKEAEIEAETKPYFEDDKKGCFKKRAKHKLSDAEYDDLMKKIVDSENFKTKALEALLLDESEVNEIEPIHFGYSVFTDDAKLRCGIDNYYRTSAWQETWIFFSKASLLVYQCEFYSDGNTRKETTYEYQYKDITSVKVVENKEEIINKVGQFFRKSCKFEICVPGDSLSCTFKNDDEQVNSVKAMKAVIRDKKNQ